MENYQIVSQDENLLAKRDPLTLHQDSPEQKLLFDLVHKLGDPTCPVHLNKIGLHCYDLSKDSRTVVAPIITTKKLDYYASSDGNILTVSKKSGSIRILKKRVERSGIPRVRIQGKNQRVDKLMCIGFYKKLIGKGGYYEGCRYRIYHEDGNPGNVIISNLSVLILRIN